jgi:hypothetical protein
MAHQRHIQILQEPTKKTTCSETSLLVVIALHKTNF